MKHLGILCLLLIVVLCGCSSPRPPNVPKQAVYVSGAKSGWWQQCEYNKTRNSDTCQIFNGAGKLIVDEEFLPFDGGSPAAEGELLIDRDSRLADVNRVALKNGRMLLRKSLFD